VTPLEERLLLTAGTLDHTFGTDGMAAISLDSGPSPQDAFASACAVDANGRIIIAGNAFGNSEEILVARLNPNGTLDTTFNNNGVVEIPDPLGAGTAYASGVAIDANGEVVVAGSAYATNGLYQMVVARLNPNGTLDSSFGIGGIIWGADASNGGSLHANAVAVQSDGKIVLAGSDSVNGVSYFALERLNHNGFSDPSFEFSNNSSLVEQQGLVLTSFPDGNGAVSSSVAYSLAIAPDGTIAAAGSSMSADGSTDQFAVALYNSDGRPDADFNAVGKTVFNFAGAGNSQAEGVSFQSTGKIIVSGYGVDTSGDYFVVIRYLPDGTLDQSFGVAGLATASFPAGNFVSGLASVLQPNDKIVQVGEFSDDLSTGRYNFAVARYTANGSPDPTFGFDGVTTTDLFGAEQNDYAEGITLQPDGKAVGVGISYDPAGYQFIDVARYNGDAGQFQLSAPNVTVGKSAGKATLTVTRTGGATGTATVQYATADGSAIAGADYTPVSGTLTFQDGQTSQTITVPIVNLGGIKGGTEYFSVTLSNPTGGATLGSQYYAYVYVLHPDIVLFPSNATEGAPLTTTLARFAGTNLFAPGADYVASINWGDNTTTTAGTLTADSSVGFDVTGTHTYAEEGTYTVTVSISGANIISGTTKITVADAPLAGTPINLTVTGKKNFSGPVATFTDADPAGKASDYTATITWDDGTTSAGTISGTGPFTVSGSHVFGAFSGTHQISVAIADAGGSKTSVTDNVIDPTPNERYVLQLYQQLLGREADPTGLASWAGLLDAGTPRIQVALAIEQSQEYRQDEVQALYAHYLYRNADPAGLAAFTQVLDIGGTLEQVAAIIVASAEYYQNRGGGTNAGFLDALYRDALGRAIDPAGATFFTQALAGSESRGQVAAALFGSPEYRQDLVESYYRGLLHRDADASGLASFVQVLGNGARDEEVLAVILGSDEFFGAL
jgi:uncharacterized delta-60 repeat protein